MDPVVVEQSPGCLPQHPQLVVEVLERVVAQLGVSHSAPLRPARVHRVGEADCSDRGLHASRLDQHLHHIIGLSNSLTRRQYWNDRLRSSAVVRRTLTFSYAPPTSSSRSRPAGAPAGPARERSSRRWWVYGRPTTSTRLLNQSCDPRSGA